MRWDFTWCSVILRDQAEGAYCIRWSYIAAWSNIPESSLNHSAGDVDQILGLAADYLSLDNRVSSEGRWDFGWLGLTGTGLGKPEIYPPPQRHDIPMHDDPVAHPEGTMSGVSVKFDMGKKGRLVKLKVDMCCSALGSCSETWIPAILSFDIFGWLHQLLQSCIPSSIPGILTCLWRLSCLKSALLHIPVNYR